MASTPSSVCSRKPCLAALEGSISPGESDPRMDSFYCPEDPAATRRAYGELLLPRQGKRQVKRYARCLGPLGCPHSDLPCGPHGPGHGPRGQAAADRKPNCVTKETLKVWDSGPPLPAQIFEV